MHLPNLRHNQTINDSEPTQLPPVNSLGHVCGSQDNTEHTSSMVRVEPSEPTRSRESSPKHRMNSSTTSLRRELSEAAGFTVRPKPQPWSSVVPKLSRHLEAQSSQRRKRLSDRGSKLHTERVVIGRLLDGPASQGQGRPSGRQGNARKSPSSGKSVFLRSAVGVHEVPDSLFPNS